RRFGFFPQRPPAGPSRGRAHTTRGRRGAKTPREVSRGIFPGPASVLEGGCGKEGGGAPGRSKGGEENLKERSLRAAVDPVVFFFQASLRSCRLLQHVAGCQLAVDLVLYNVQHKVRQFPRDSRIL